MIAAALYIGGALLVFFAAFMPLAARVYGRPPEQQVAAVNASRGAWRWHNILFAAGSTVTAGAAVYDAIGSDSTARVGAAVGFVLGAALFVHFLQARTLMPPSAWFGSDLGRRRFASYTVLTAAALALRGVAGVQDGSAWAMLLVGYGVLLLALFAILRDMPPFAHYVGTLVLGIVLLP